MILFGVTLELSLSAISYMHNKSQLALFAKNILNVCCSLAKVYVHLHANVHLVSKYCDLFYFHDVCVCVSGH